MISMKNSGGLRQKMFPPEFRISEAPWPESAIQQLEQIAEQITKQAHEEQTPVDPESSRGRKCLSRRGWYWLVASAPEDGAARGTDKPLEEMRRAYRHFESVWEALERDGVRIYDHTGEDFDAGRSIKVLAYQPTTGLSRERVLETIKPTIYIQNDRVQMGEVIVGTPES